MTTNNDLPRQERDAPEDLHYHVVATGRQYLLVRHTHAWHPPTDVMEDEEGLHIMVEVAGMQDGEFHVTLHQRRLTISGVRAAPTRNHAAFHQLEIRRGEFRTEVAIPWPADEEAVGARYHDGFLHVTVPRARATQVRVVDVEKVNKDQPD